VPVNGMTIPTLMVSCAAASPTIATAILRGVTTRAMDVLHMTNLHGKGWFGLARWSGLFHRVET